MTPQDQAGQMPPGLMDALMGSQGPPAPPGLDPNADPHAHLPDAIDVGGGNDPSVPADGPSMSPEEHLQAAIDHAQMALHSEPDSADSAKLAKIVHELYAVQSTQQDAQTQAQGGNPKQHRTLSKLHGGAVHSGSLGTTAGGGPTGGGLGPAGNGLGAIG